MTERVCKTRGLSHAAFDSPVAHHLCGRSSKAEYRGANAVTRVRLSSSAPNQCPVSKSGDCAALKAQTGRFESDAGHQFGAAAGAELSLARMMGWVRFPDAPPNSFRSSALGVCIRLLIGPRLVRIQRPEPIAAFVYWLGCRVLNPVKWDRYPYAAPVSSRSSTGRAPCYERGGCRFDSCREGNHQGVGEPSRPRLPWKQENVGANPTTLTNLDAL